MRFEKDDLLDEVEVAMENKPEEAEESTYPAAPVMDIHSESWCNVNDVQKRNLDYWCFAEHHEPNILLQVSWEGKGGRGRGGRKIGVGRGI